MIKEIEIKLSPEQAHDPEVVLEMALQKLQMPAKKPADWEILRRSIDARAGKPQFLLKVRLFFDESRVPEPALLPQLKPVHEAKHALIIGAGPAGYFAALELLERGIKPIVLDRGQDVRLRRRDLRNIQQLGIVNPDSNYCFGEGGAGAYSDGKLYTRSHKRGNIYKTLKLFVEHGADHDILVDAHPHIGSNKLPKIVANIRATIEHYGGQVWFNKTVTSLRCHAGKIRGVVVNQNEEWSADAVLLATGHSARDVYRLLQDQQLSIEFKPFALGVRIEHPQALVDSIQYRQPVRSSYLPAASYRLACQIKERGVFSFCMCPGGLVVPAATAPGEIVINGMSMSRRDSAYANAGTVVTIEEKDLSALGLTGPLAGIHFQQQVEQAMFGAGDGSQKAPALRMTDFVMKRTSAFLPQSSYIPGLIGAPLYELLPAFVYDTLRQGVVQFGKAMKGYYTEEAVVIGTESRTSAPVRVPRNDETYMHPGCAGLFPCGEGAGYAGGIISAAIDGQNVARAIHHYFSGI